MPVYLMPLDEGRRIPLDKAVIFLGRHPECDVVLARSRKVSRRHCCIAQVNGTFVVRDLGSTNGVRINGDPVGKEARMNIGDEVTIGDLRYTVRSEPKHDGTSPQRSNGRSGRPEAKANGGPSSVGPSPPVNISQNFPVPLDDEGKEFEVLPSARDLPHVIVPAADGEADAAEDELDDIVLLGDESDESNAGGSDDKQGPV